MASRHPDTFFVATKTGERSYAAAREEIRRSLDRLGVDRVDSIQLHNLVDAVDWEVALRENGALEAAVEARDEGLVRFIGVTGHGLSVPAMHRRSLERFPFDSVLLPYNYVQMRDPRYAEAFDALAAVCAERNVALQTIKSLASRPWDGRAQTASTWYEPLREQADIDLAAHWVLGNPQAFLLTTGDVETLPRLLDAAARFEARPADAEMDALAERRRARAAVRLAVAGQRRLALGHAEPALVERLADDHAREVDLAQRAQRAQVLQRADPARVEEAAADRARRRARRRRATAPPAPRRGRRPCRRRSRRRGRCRRSIASVAGRSETSVQPAVAMRPPRTSTDTTTRVAVRGHDRVEEVDVAQRRRPDDHPLRARRAAPSPPRRRPAARRRTAPARPCPRDPAQVPERRRHARARAVEVDHVQEARARRHPRPRGRERVVVVDGLVLEAPVREPHGPAAADVDGRVEDQAAHAHAHEVAQQRQPVARGLLRMELRAHDVAALRRSTRSARRSRPSRRRRASSAGRATNECTW